MGQMGRSASPDNMSDIAYGVSQASVLYAFEFDPIKMKSWVHTDQQNTGYTIKQIYSMQNEGYNKYKDEQTR